MEEKSLHIIELQSENVKRLSAVRIRPNGKLIRIAGKNGQGKTSLLDSIEMALGGGKTIPVEPVRRGARNARIVVDLGDIVVERTFTPKGTALEVRNKDGIPQRSPQALLDQLCSRVSFDPLAFAREEPKKQDEILKRVLGLDFSDLEEKHAKLYAERRDETRDLRASQARLGAAPRHSDVPAESVSVVTLTQELDRLRDVESENRNKRRQFEMSRDAVSDCGAKVESIEAQIEVLSVALSLTKQELDGKTETYMALGNMMSRLTDPGPEIAELREKIAGAEETNRKIRENLESARLRVEVEARENLVEKLTEQIGYIAEAKQTRLAEAKFPVPGLGFDDSGPTLNGIPLSQSSQAERLRVSIAIGAALNPRVKVMLVRDASLLDDDAMLLLAKFAEETDTQIWLERVGNADEGAIIIEDGMVFDEAQQGAAE